MLDSWIDEICPENYPAQTLHCEGIEILSEIALVKRRAIERGPQDYVTVWIKSSRGDKSIENTLSFEPNPRYSKTQFERDLLGARVRFATEFAKEVLGTAPPKPVFWAVSVWNPDEPSKRMTAAAVPDESVPVTLVQKEMVDALGLKDSTGGSKAAAIRVLGRAFFTDVVPAEMSIPVVVGADLIERVRSDGQEKTGDLSELFKTNHIEAISARRKAKEDTVLLIGSYSHEGLARLRQLETLLLRMGYDPIVIIDYPGLPEALEAKFLSVAVISKFVVYEASFSSGAIDEYKICKDNRIVTCVLHESGKLATSMQDYQTDHNFIQVFPYEMKSLQTVLAHAASWAESYVAKRKADYEAELNKKRYQ